MKWYSHKVRRNISINVAFKIPKWQISLPFDNVKPQKGTPLGRDLPV